MRRVRTVALALLVLGAWVNPARAAITSSSIDSPGNGAELFYNGDTHSGSVTVTGSVSGASPGARGDLLCYWNDDQNFDRVASAINVSSGTFAGDFSLAPVAGRVCRLAIVPSGETPTGSAAASFAGPAISVTDRFSHSANGNLYGYEVLSGTLPWSFDFGSLGECPIRASYATDPQSLGSFSLFAGNACLPELSGIPPNQQTRSALQVDGLNAYPPGAIPSLSNLAGYEPLAYSTSFDATHDTVTITDHEIPTICNPPATFPPNSTTCPALHDSGIEVEQTTTLAPGGEIARVGQRFYSVDGRSHTLDLLFSQSVIAPAGGGSPGFMFPGQSSFATHSAPDSFATFPRGPGSIVVISNAAAPPADSNPIGAITYGTPPSSANFTTSTGSQTATFLLHYTATIPARGSVTYNWSFTQASNAFGAAVLARIELDRFYKPAIVITRPRSGAVTRRPLVAVTGRASDPVVVAAVSVNGRAATVSSRGTFRAVVRLHPGRNLVVATVRNGGGNTARAAVRVTYKPLPCVVPRLAGRTLAQAKAALSGADCTLGRVFRARSLRVRRGRVIGSSPAAGTRHRPGARVNLTLSAGR